MIETQIPQKLKANIVIFKIMAWITLIGTILAGLGIMVSGIVSDDSEALIGMAIIGIFTIIVGVLIGIFYFKIAKGIAGAKSWSKTWGMVFSIIWLFSVPVGTILGIVEMQAPQLL